VARWIPNAATLRVRYGHMSWGAQRVVMKAIILAVGLIVFLATPASGSFSRDVRGHAHTDAVEFGASTDRAKVSLTIRSRLPTGTNAYCRVLVWTDWMVDSDRDGSTFDPTTVTFKGVAFYRIRLKAGRHRYRLGWITVDHPTMDPLLDQPAPNQEGFLPNGRSFLRRCHG